MLTFATMGSLPSRNLSIPARCNLATLPSLPQSEVKPIHQAESALLAALTSTPYLKRQIHLPGGHTLNTLSAGPLSAPPLLLLHGWGGGLALFGRNLEGLSKHFRVHLIDLLGFGASSRPVHRLDFSPEQAEAFFVQPVVQWIEEMGKRENFSSIHLVGHSMGGFIAAGVKMNRPDLIRKLVLVCPIGVPKRPTSKQNVRWGLKVLFLFWDWGWTPQILIRWGGSIAGRYVAKWMILKRFYAEGAVGERLTDYFYEISRARASGELAICTVLESGAWARRPLVERLKRGGVRFLYGRKDWIAKEGGVQVVGEADVRVLAGGHHTYFEEYSEFDKEVVRACLGEA